MTAKLNIEEYETGREREWESERLWEKERERESVSERGERDRLAIDREKGRER